MDATATSRLARLALAAATLALALAIAPLPVRADEIAAADRASSALVVHDAAEVLAVYCRIEDGALWLTLPSGGRFELITSTEDPAIANPGDGAFHPFDAGEARATIAGLRYPLAGIGAEVFVLPYPRRAGLESCAGPGLVMLAPGVRPLSPEQQHATLTHELGHVLQYARMPDSDADAWSRWRTLRGLTDAATYAATAPHADRPHEIFAEDFRELFGDALATANGGIENSTLADPASVSGLESFMRSLNPPAGGSLTALNAWPNPMRGAVRFARSGSAGRTLEVFDIGGRRVAALAPEAAGGGVGWSWDGRDTAGRALPPGRYLARERGSAATIAITRTR